MISHRKMLHSGPRFFYNLSIKLLATKAACSTKGITPVSTHRYLFTSESVSMGHPDKVADQISDAILDHCLSADRFSRVACETLVTTDFVVVAGEITTKADLSKPAVERVVRDVILEIGYTDPRT